MREYWTLERRGDALGPGLDRAGRRGRARAQGQDRPDAWADEQSLRDEALVEGAVAAECPAGFKLAELADLQFTGDARAAALDLSLADGRFAPDILEVAARRAVDAWAEAVDGSDAELRKIATARRSRSSCIPAIRAAGRDWSSAARGRHRIRIVALDAAAEPATMTIDVDLRGRRYIEDRDTTQVLAGSSTRLRVSPSAGRWP